MRSNICEARGNGRPIGPALPSARLSFNHNVHCRFNNYGRGNRFNHASPQWLYWLHNRHNRHNDRALLRFRYFLRLSFPVAQVVDNYHGLPILAVFVDKEEVNHVLLLAVVLTKSNARDLVERVENVSSVASVWFSIVH